jgi:hypothetical protein
VRFTCAGLKLDRSATVIIVGMGPYKTFEEDNTSCTERASGLAVAAAFDYLAMAI